jgi:COMPASS component SWD1
MIATVSSFSGAIYLWQHLPAQKYSAFDPTFTDIEDNQEYMEREDEFDKVRMY